MDTRKGPLSGFRVLELGNLIAAPYAGRLFADFGADVIKVERPRTGDELRQWRLFRGNTSLFWSLQARNKRSITLDLRTPEGSALQWRRRSSEEEQARQFSSRSYPLFRLRFLRGFSSHHCRASTLCHQNSMLVIGAMFEGHDTSIRSSLGRA